MSRTVTLKHPFTHQGAEHSALTLRRPKVRDEKDARRAEKEPGAQEVRLFANLCEVPPGAIEEMDLVDYRALQEAFQGFFTDADAPD